jgi:DNA polymerase III alpha subunit
MSERGIPSSTQDEIVQQITSFALYGFPESHAASFALLAYASAYIRAHHHACYLTAMLNAYPLGFYSPATLVKDAERHGVRVLPIDVQQSGWLCRVEKDDAANRQEEQAPQARAVSQRRAKPGRREARNQRAVRQGELCSPLGRSDPPADNRVRLGLRYLEPLRSARSPTSPGAPAFTATSSSGSARSGRARRSACGAARRSGRSPRSRGDCSPERSPRRPLRSAR